MPARDGGKIRYVETFRDCERCSLGCDDPFDKARQERYRCPMVSRSLWSTPGQHPARFMGVHDEAGAETYEGNEDGCVGGWYRCVFVWSVSPYMRPVSDGNYSDNLHLSRCDDRLVIDAVHYFEQERARWRGWAHDLSS